VIPVSKLLQLSLNWLTVPSFTICQHLLRVDDFFSSTKLNILNDTSKKIIIYPVLTKQASSFSYFLFIFLQSVNSETKSPRPNEKTKLSKFDLEPVTSEIY
jgi:hypothetical protein